MRKERLIGKERSAGYLLTFMQGLLIALLAVFFLNQQYMAVWRAYPQSGGALTVYLKNVAAEKQRDTQNFLLRAAEEQELFIARMDEHLDNSGSFQGYKFGVYGNTESRQAELSFLKEDILTSADLKALLESDHPDSTLGIETGSIHSVGEIPSFRFCEHIVIKQLPAFIADSQTVNGVYKILGLEGGPGHQDFLQGLAGASGLTERELLEAGSGSNTNNLVMRDILFAFLGAQIFLNTVFCVSAAMRSLPKQGKLTLLGWSRLAFAKEILGGFFASSIAAVPVLVIANSVIAGWGTFSLPLLGCYLAAVFRMANQETINVKKFMGFSFPQMYGKPLLLLSGMLVLEFAAMLALKSRFGLLLVGSVFLVQAVIFIKYMAHNELKNVLTAFKGE